MMTPLASLLICVGAVAALAMATERAQQDVLGRALSPDATRMLRITGWALLFASLAIVVGAQGWGLGLVSYSGHTSVAAGLVFVGLIASQRRKG